MSLDADLIRRLEGRSLTSYPDPASPRAVQKRRTGVDDPSLSGKPWTIGFGHTGQGIGPGLVWTPEQCDSQLEHDLVAFRSVVDSLVKVPITESERAALVSFSFNEGSSRLSDPACRILHHLNLGDHLTAAGQFMHWTMANGQRILVSRRMAEIEMFLSELGVF